MVGAERCEALKLDIGAQSANACADRNNRLEESNGDTGTITATDP